jgi:hypothetical protein
MWSWVSRFDKVNSRYSKDLRSEAVALIGPQRGLANFELKSIVYWSNGVVEWWSNAKTKNWNLVGISISFERLALNMPYVVCVHRLDVRIVI